MRTRRYLTCVLLLVACLSPKTAFAEDPVYFADANLKAVVEQTLGTLNPTPSDMLHLTALGAEHTDIASFVGLEYATNLQRLTLYDSLVSDLSPLSGLTKLQYLAVNENLVSDLSPLSGLTNLSEASLFSNRISRIPPLSGLPNLQTLYLNSNQINDLSGLSSMTSLTTLDLYDNQISDLSPLAALTGLSVLGLGSNKISDASPLAGLTKLADLSLNGNPLNDLAPLANLTNLWQLDLQGDQISDLSPLAGLTNLYCLYLSNNQISDISALAGLTNLRTLYLNDNQISDISPLVGLTSFDSLLLWNNPLDRDAYCHDLEAIGIYVEVSPNRNPPGGVSATDGTYKDKVTIGWDALCDGPYRNDTFSYRVHRSTSPDGTQVAVSDWLSSTSFADTSASPGIHYWYWVKSNNSGEVYSDPDEGWCSAVPQRTLIISPAAGGVVTAPGEGTFHYDHGTEVLLQAEPYPLFEFAGWRGQIFSGDNPMLVTMDGNRSVRPCFESILPVLYVDDDAITDPGPGDPSVSDSGENGTMEHPFDCIQEAIDVAKPGARVIVRPGTYFETIDLLGKGIEVTGLDESDPNIAPLPIIDGGGKDTVVKFTQGEDPNCVLRGLVITGGKGQLAGGILCARSSPTVRNCLIVGNRATSPDGGGGIYCRASSALFVNCTISGNYGGSTGGGVCFSDSNAVLSDSIVWENLPSQVRMLGSGDSVVAYTAVAGGWPGPGNLDVDPLFARAGYWADPADITKALPASDPSAVWVDGDYHLLSEAGRWDAVLKTWIKDPATSPCIDAGDPSAPIGREPSPNAGRINLGVYGGTNQASLSAGER